MTFVSMEKITETPVSARIFGMVANIRSAHANRKMYNKTIRELSALSDRELHDLGLSRASISDVARSAVYMK